MADRPSVSVIMPARNAEATIEAALESLKVQSVIDWEALVVDDRSTDDTAAILQRMALADPRIRYMLGGGEGAAGARNRGIAAAQAPWLAFLDADDWVDAAFLAKMLDALKAAPDHQIAYCAYRRVMPDGSMTDGFADPRVRDEPFETFARTCAVVTINCLLVDRQMVVDAGGFDTGLRTCEDWDLWQRLSRAGARWLMVDEALSYYRSSTGSLTRDSGQMLADGRTVIRRAFDADPRVAHPLPAYAQGITDARGLSMEEAYAWFAFWNIIVAEVGGVGAPVDVEPLAHLSHGPDRAEAIADNIIEALVVGLRLVPAQLAAHWAAYAGIIDRFLAELGRLWNDAGAERRIRYALDRKLIAYDSLAEPRMLGLTLGLRVAMDAPPDVALPPGIDRLHAYIVWQDEVRSIAEPGALGGFGALEWVDQIHFPDQSREAIGGFIRWLAAPVAISHALSAHGLDWQAPPLQARMSRKLGTLFGVGPTPYAAALAEGEAVIARAPELYPAGGHNHALARRAVEARARALATPRPVMPTVALRETPAEAERSGDRKAFWDSYFAHEDPWNYGSPYEQEKYRLQLSLLPDRPLGRALELACAEGVFTAQLADRVDHLLATDIAEPAVSRARHRLADRTNIDFAVLDLARDALPIGLDLIICSEVLYYLDDEAELASVAARLAAALGPGGTLVTAHAHMIADDRSRTGFDWSNPFGVKVIADVLAATPGLALDHSIQTELYRVDRFCRVADDAVHPSPLVQDHALMAPLELSVARRVIWNSAPTLRAEAADERRATLPVLMYHAVAEGGSDELRRYRVAPGMFRDQMRWLRSHGYHTVTADQVQWHLAHDEPFTGRPVWITFDDGLQDFADHGWPLLQALDMTAEIFLVTDHVGGRAQWDARFGVPAPLMDAATIARLAGEGVFFGSHLASHSAADGLSTAALADEMLRSRAMIERWIGWAPAALAAPYGAIDERFGRLASQCGYTLAIGGGQGAVTLGQSPFDLTRMEVRGDHSLADFTGMMEALL
ncbi:trifunctional glycosyltransferase/class I SAM-dependent methyltransferase/polysaccharide deacetylase [Sphingobium sp. B2]|uniref:trifunctional glycosyltransferase/class I SAM-dependent methyltransferase/polysaccharide deacetylase n=1 Tax=Sphingobium sp. B2 TaxID=2583228 RepID=UPI00119EBD74|nr:trifunctional glycosyltransferase/class I SAM-dependent methyltransferase/polysaccharide deacetylase [Sphingobium sp. B2]